MSPCRPPQGQVGTGRVGTTGGWLRAGPGGQPHCTPSLALISAQCGAHSSRTALGVTRHASGHQTGSSFHLVQLWRGASGLTLPPLGRGPVPAWSEAVARSQTLPPLLPVHRPFYRTSCSRMAGQGGPSPGRQGRGGPSPGQWGRVAPLQNCGSRALPLQDRASPGALALPALSCLTHCPL